MDTEFCVDLMVCDVQRGIEQLREINQNLALRSRDFEKMRARNLERLQDNIGCKCTITLYHLHRLCSHNCCMLTFF